MNELKFAETGSLNHSISLVRREYEMISLLVVYIIR